MVLIDAVELISGSSQFRISEARSPDAPTYLFYTQANLENDLRGIVEDEADAKQIATFDQVTTAVPGNVVFSLVTGRTSIVGEGRANYLLTQNYVVLGHIRGIDPKYLVYLLNEDRGIRRQLRLGQQGSSVAIKYTIHQLREIKLPRLPNLQTQELVGSLYFDQLRLETLKKRVAELETTLLLKKIGGAGQL